MNIVRISKLNKEATLIPFTSYCGNETLVVNDKKIVFNFDLATAIITALYSKFSVGEVGGKIFLEFSNLEGSEKYRALFVRENDIATLQMNGCFEKGSNPVTLFPVVIETLIRNEEIRKLYSELKGIEMLEDKHKNTFAELFSAIYFANRNLDVTIDEENIAMIETLDKNFTDLFCENNFKTVKAPTKRKKIPSIDMGRELTEKEKEQIPAINLCNMYVSPIVERIAFSMAKGSKSSFFFGPAGLGKSTATDIICKLINLPVKAIVNCSNELDQYVLAKWIPSGESFTLKRSAVTDAIENGGAVIFEELNFANPKHTSFLFSILDDHNRVMLDDGTTIKVHPAFRFFATMNPSYSGTNVVNNALLRRFSTGMFFEEMTYEQLHKIVDEYVSFDIAENMILVYNKIREKIIIEQREEIVTPRYLKAWAKAIKYSNVFEAAEQTIVSCAVNDNEFRTWIKDMVNVSFVVEKTTVSSNIPKMNAVFSEEQKALIPHKDKELYKRVPESISVSKLLSSGDATSAIFFGGTGTGKSTMCEYICDDIGCPIIEIVNCTSALDKNILGKWIPCEKGFVFKKSKVADAIENGGAVIFEEINFGDARYMSFFHSLMDQRQFVELEDGTIIKVNPNFRLFATMNPNYAGTSMLNLALFDRFNIKLYVGELEAEAIKTYISKFYKTTDEDFEIMLSVYNAVKSKIEEEERDEAISPDIIKNWARELANGFDIFEASEMTILNIALDDMEFRSWISNIISTIVKTQAIKTSKGE